MGPKRSRISSGSKRSKVVSREDRISNLPDSLLLVILSLLPFDSAVRTSVLSKRWKPLCMSFSNLCFDDNFGKNSRAHCVNSFDRFLMLRPLDLNIELFGLKCQGDYDPARINQWIRKALELQVKDFSLGFYFDYGSYELLPDIYTYERFEALRLTSKIFVDIPNHVSFSRLKVLEFNFVQFSNYESIEALLLNCPVLEDLVITGCLPLSGSCLTVCGSALKNLTLEYNDPPNSDTDLKIVIDTPGLEALKIGDSTCANISIKSTLLSLRTAHIDVGVDQLECNTSVFQLLDNMFHVKCLTLSDKAIGVFNWVHTLPSDLHYRFPTFHNLIQLELSVNNWSCWNLLPIMIASSPNLQCLLLPSGVDLEHTRRKRRYGLWSTPKSVPECLSSTLKTVEIGIFHGTDDELSLVDYLLLEGKVLRKISISCKARIRKEVLSLNSKTCKVHFI